MGQLCSCARAQDTRGRKFVQNTILSRSPSAKSGCYVLNNVNGKPPPDGAVHSTVGVRHVHPTGGRQPRSQQGSLLEESGVFSKASSTDEYSTAIYGAPKVSQTIPDNAAPSFCLNHEQSEKRVESTEGGGGGKSTLSVTSNIAILEKSSSVNDVTPTSPAGVTLLDLKTSASLPRDTGNRMDANGKLLPGSDQLEAQAQKVRSVLQRTVAVLAMEIDSASIAEYLQKSRPGLELTEAEWSQCCNQTAAQDLFWDIITGQEQENYEIFCEVIGSKIHLQHLVDLLQTLDSLIALISPDIDDDDENSTEDEWNQADDCDSCNDAKSSDFDLDLVFCHRDFATAGAIGSGMDERSQLSVQVDCSSLSLAGGSYLPSITSDELGQPNVPMLSLSLINYCMCRRKRASLIRQVLEDSSCIRELSLVKTHISNDDLALLMQTLRTNSSLVRLDLRLSSFGNEAAGHLGDAFRHNSSLRILNVASTGLSDIGCSRLMSGLARNRVLSDLDIGFNDIRDNGCQSIADTLSRSNPLRKVRMRDNGITCYGACALFQSLAKNCRLSFLDISSNGIGNDSLRHLSEALISNRTLRELNLENCRISVDGCTSLARALRANTALRCLQLSLNPITDVGLDALADGLRYNHAVDTLSVNMCNVGNSGFMCLLEALRFNFTLKTIKLCYNNIGAGSQPQKQDGIIRIASQSLDEIITRLYEVLHYNPKLKILLWGNQLERAQSTTPGSLDVGSLFANRSASFSKSSKYSPALNLYRQDILVSV